MADIDAEDPTAGPSTCPPTALPGSEAWTAPPRQKANTKPAIVQGTVRTELDKSLCGQGGLGLEGTQT